MKKTTTCRVREAFSRFVVRLVPLVNLLGFWRTRIPCCEVLQILPDRFLGDVAVLTEYNKFCKAREAPNMFGISEPQRIWNEVQKFL